MDLKLAVVADVRQGTRPVLGAKVTAVVERPSQGGIVSPQVMMTIPMLLFPLPDLYSI